jgi:hypothetical protein
MASDKASDLTLRFQSPEIALGILGDAAPSEAHFEGWRLRELFIPQAHPEIAPDIGSYSLLVERQLTLDDDARHWHTVGVDLVERIDRLWAFAAGLPLRSRGFQVTLASIEAPKGWQSNVKEIDHAIQAATQDIIVGSVGFSSRHWRYAPEFPLVQLVQGLNSYIVADELVRELIDLHYEAHHSASSRSRAVLFAKALEIVRELLPGRDDRSREAELPVHVREALSHSLAWLYNLSNNRRNTRHPVTKQPNLALHPEMPGSEYMDYLRNADLLIRYVGSAKLGLNLVVLQDHRPTSRPT